MRITLVVISVSFICSLGAYAIDGVIKENKYTTIDGAVTVVLPKDIKPNGIKDAADGQGISAQAAILHKGQAITCIYTTKIRKEFPQTDIILTRTAARYRQNIKAEDGSTLEYIEMLNVAQRKVLISVVRHIEAGNATTLNDKWLKTKLLVRGDVIESRMYLVHNGYLVEFKHMVMPTLALNMSEPDENTIAKSALVQLRNFVCSSSAITKEEREIFSKQTFEKEYVRGVFKDPSLEVAQ